MLMSTDVVFESDYLEDGRVEEIQFDLESDSVKYLSISERNHIALEYRSHARKMAHGILAKWHARLNTEDLYSIVDHSLCEATSRFDPQRGVSFVTFLFYHLKGNLVKAIKYQTKESVVSLMNDELEVGENLCFKRDNSVLNENDRIDEISFLNGKTIQSPEESLLSKEGIEVVAQACEKLDKIEKEIIYRLFMKEEHVFDVAAEFGYSRCHVSRIKKSALMNLRKEIARIFEERCEVDERFTNRSPRQISRRQPRSRKIYEQQMEKKVATVGM